MLKKIKFIIPPALTMAILYLLLRNFEIKNFQDILAESNKAVLFFATALLLAFVPAIAALRWKQTLKFINFDISFWDSFKIYMAVLPLSKISPSNAGDFARSYYMKDKISPAMSAGTVIFERIIDVAMVSLFALIGGLILNIKIAIITGSLTLFLIIVFFAIARKIKPESENK